MEETKNDGCHCAECAIIHSDFITHFDKWPQMTHEEGQALQRSREENERSWNRMVELEG